jgi:hypothetical protein
MHSARTARSRLQRRLQDRRDEIFATEEAIFATEEAKVSHLIRNVLGDALDTEQTRLNLLRWFESLYWAAWLKLIADPPSDVPGMMTTDVDVCNFRRAAEGLPAYSLSPKWFPHTTWAPFVLDTIPETNPDTIPATEFMFLCFIGGDGGNPEHWMKRLSRRQFVANPRLANVACPSAPVAWATADGTLIGSDSVGSRFCDVCGELGDKACACNDVKYCGAACQRAAWPAHRVTCTAARRCCDVCGEQC